MKFWSFVIPILWMIVVSVLHLVKVDIDNDRAKLIPHADKIVHFGMFATMAFLLVRSFLLNSNYKKQTIILLVFFMCIGYGALMEYLQTLTPAKRDSDLFDWFADVFGAAVGIAVSGTTFLPFFFHHQIRKSSQ